MDKLKKDLVKKEKTAKKGEISTSFVIAMIILVMGFVILLIFFYNVGGTGQMDKTVCHQSVIFRATLPSLVEDYIPLKCQTEKICIVPSNFLGTNKANCEEFKGEKGILTVKAKNIQQIEKLYAQKIVECLEMMGEGKVSLFNQYIAKNYGLGKVYPSCVICARIAYDKTAFEKMNKEAEETGKLKIDFSKMDVARYMLEHKMPGKNITYFEYVAGENGKVAIKEKLMEGKLVVNEGKDKEGEVVIKINPPAEDAKEVESGSVTNKVDVATIKLSELNEDELKQQEELQTKENAIIFMQISSPEQAKSLANIVKTIAVGGATSYALAPSLTGIAVRAGVGACTKSGVGALVCGGILALVGGAQQSLVAYNRAITSGYCGDISVGTEARSGCSAVRVINYDVADISSYCSVIESIP
jgi:hypothetical protein